MPPHSSSSAFQFELGRVPIEIQREEWNSLGEGRKGRRIPPPAQLIAHPSTLTENWNRQMTFDWVLNVFFQNFFSNETTWKFISSNALVSVKKGRQQNMHFATFFPSLLEFSSRNAFYEPRLDTKQAQTIRIPWENSLADEIFWKLITLD